MLKNRSSEDTGIRAVLQGGLGNQLFIYAAAAEQASRLGVPVELLEPDNLPHGGNQITPIALRAKGFIPLVHNHMYLKNIDSLESRLDLALSRRIRTYARYRKIFVEGSTKYDPRINQIRRGTTLFGFFQSAKYFSHSDSELRSEILQFSGENANANFVDWKKRISGSPNSISVHVRRGDYLQSSSTKFHGLTGKEYFKAAVDMLRLRGYDGQIYLFSDDPLSAQKELSFLESIVVDNAGSLSPLETLMVMAESSAGVMSNSSFSWWASWIRDNTEGTIAPYPWFALRKRTDTDLVLNEWSRLGIQSGMMI